MLFRSRFRFRRAATRLAVAILAAATASLAPAGAQSAPSSSAETTRVSVPASARQGDLLVAWAAAQGPGPFEARLVSAAGKTSARVAGFDASALDPASASGTGLRPYGFLLAVPTRLPPGRYELELIGTSRPVEILGRAFVSETIALDARNSEIRTAEDARKEEEARRLYALLARSDPDAVLAGGGFALPVGEDARRSSLFGDRRTYAYATGGTDTSEHSGIDFAVVEGTPVGACANGRVAMVADRFVTGRTVVLEHLPGLYSIYMHLSSVEVEEGAIVERGQTIARSGSTGLSTGPHLHWELRTGSVAFDPDCLLIGSPLDKALIINTIRALIEGR